jgi:CubicO group peptidase (beta-lactamase class C family)
MPTGSGAAHSRSPASNRNAGGAVMNWYVTRLDDGSRMIGKDGGNAGFSAWIGFIPEQQAGIALLSNGHPAGISLTRAGKKILLEATGISADDARLETGDEGAAGAGIGGRR